MTLTIWLNSFLDWVISRFKSVPAARIFADGFSDKSSERSLTFDGSSKRSVLFPSLNLTLIFFYFLRQFKALTNSD